MSEFEGPRPDQPKEEVKKPTVAKEDGLFRRAWSKMRYLKPTANAIADRLLGYKSMRERWENEPSPVKHLARDFDIKPKDPEKRAKIDAMELKLKGIKELFDQKLNNSPIIDHLIGETSPPTDYEFQLLVVKEYAYVEPNGTKWAVTKQEEPSETII